MGDVVLHIYDLSMGMARGMSQALLGVQIDLIPHTGVVFQGKEYFFGGGIQCVHPHEVVEFYGLRPAERVTLGTSRKTDSDLRAFLRTINHRFTMNTYDLFTNNCNNFSDELCKFLLDGTGVPARILDIPRIALASPLGPTLGQIMTSMNQRMGQGAGTGSDPFTALAGGRVPEGATISGGAASTPAQPPSTVAHSHSTQAQALPAASQVLHEPASAAPVLSTDTGGVPSMVKRLRESGAASGVSLSEEEEGALVAMSEAVAGGRSVRDGWQEGVCSLLAKALCTWPASSAAFPVAGLGRLLVIRPDCMPVLTAQCSQGHSLLLQAVQLLERQKENGLAVSSLLLLYTLLTNLFASEAGRAWAVSAPWVGRLSDMGAIGIGHGRAEVRLTASALLLNLANAIPPGSSSPGVSSTLGDASVGIADSSVQVLCACLDGCDGEGEKEVSRRRLLAAGRILVRQGHEASALAATLGYDAPVLSIASDGGREGTLRALAVEVLTLLQAGQHRHG